MTSYKSFTKHSFLRYLPAAALCCLCSLFAARSQGAEKDDVLELAPVVSVAHRSPSPLNQVGSTVTVLDHFELERDGGRFLLDSLRSIPGLYLRNNGGPGGTFGITTRGLSSNRPTVLINGIEVSNPSNGQILNPGSLLTRNVARVEVLKGPQSSLYGADALAGVISIESLGAGMRPGGRLSFGYGSYDTYEVGIGHSGSQDRLSWSIDANHYQTEGISAQNPDFGIEWADDDAYDVFNLSSSVNYDVSESLSVYISSYYIDAYSEFDPGVPPLWSAPYDNNFSEKEELYLKAGTRFEITEEWSSDFSLGYADVDYLSHDGFDYFANGDRYQLDWTHQLSLSEAWQLIAGVEHEIEDNRSADGDRNNTSLYAENLLAIGEFLDLSLGGRYDDNSRYGKEGTYRATLSYRLESLNARVRGSFGTSFQAPTFFQLTPPWGNPELKPETGEGWDLGYFQSFEDGKFSVESTLFGNRISDRIDWINGNYANVSRYESRGIENALRFQARDSVLLTLSHAYSEGEENERQEALRVPRNIVTAGVYWTMMDDALELSLMANAVSSQYSSAIERSSGAKQDGYEVVTASARYAFSNWHSAWFRVGNLFDADYEEISGYQTAGRHFNAGLELSF